MTSTMEEVNFKFVFNFNIYIWLVTRLPWWLSP